MFFSYFVVLFLLIGVEIGNSSKFIIRKRQLKLNPKNCSSVHTGTGVTCRYEFFKYFNGGHTHPGWETINIAQITSTVIFPNKTRCSNKRFLDLVENDYNKFSIYTKRYNYNIKQREVDGFWISGKELGNYRI